MRIAVIGGGPGGAAAALRLALGGAAVTFFCPDKRGEKPCGGGLPSWLLPRIEGFEPRDLPAVAIESALIENGSGGRVEVPAEGLRIFRRGDFDGALVAAAVAAGAEHVAAPVRGLTWSAGRPVLMVEGMARSFDWVVGADGARGISRRSLGLRPEGDSLGLGASLVLPEPDEPVGGRLDGAPTGRQVVLSLCGVADAYAWIFPRPGGASVGVAYSPERLSDGGAGTLLASFLARFAGRVGGAAVKPRYRYPIPVYGPWTGPSLERGLARRVLLVGDAAAVADPLTREGIRYSVLSGQWAADCLLAGSPARYPRRVHGEMAGEMDRAHRARDLFFDDSIAQLMVPLARLHSGIGSVLSDLISCRQGYRGLRRRLLRAVVGLGSGA